ncbi:MAG: restriction endonuclease subunit S [Alphaproteobacteria bacterium]|nr:restriction endonuclease subunit S [Alphaproteobacteria bacterium]
MLSHGGSTDPSKTPNDPFVLYSIPAFDVGQPEFVRGRDIGSSKKNIESGDVLLSRIVPHIRRSWVVGYHPNEKILASGEWIVFRSSKIHASYLRHFLISEIFHRQFMQTVAGVGGSLLRANPNQVSKITIPLPPLDEQRRIAAILDKADALRRKRRQALGLPDNLTQSIFLDMFGDPARNSRGFQTSAFEPLLKVPPNFGSMIPPRAQKLEWVSLRVANIQNWALTLDDSKYIDLPLDSVERHTLLDGDIILARAIASEEHLGKCVVVRPAGRKWAFDSHLMRIRLDTEIIDPVYVRELFRTPGGRQIFFAQQGGQRCNTTLILRS